ncbi:MAG TPA: hypothetical protein VNH17_23490 [Streptosporangiaceae bacterium]|nr:hypothetical protein [Streptosporangiaceae bacterium]
MADELLNGREATDWELAALERGRRCELARAAEVVAGLIAEYPRAESPASRPLTTVAELS